MIMFFPGMHAIPPSQDDEPEDSQVVEVKYNDYIFIAFIVILFLAGIIGGVMSMLTPSNI